MADGMKIVSDRWMLQSRQIVNWGSMEAGMNSAHPWTTSCL